VQRRRLAFDFLPDRVAGPVGVDLTYWTLDGVRAEAEAEAALDLRSASLSVTEAGWKKPAGAPAGAKLVLDLQNEQVTRLRDIEVKAAGLDGRFAVALEPDSGQIDRVDVQRLVIAEDDVSGSVMRRREGGWQIDLRGPTLDLSHWINDPRKQSSITEAPLQIDARLGRLVVGGGKGYGLGLRVRRDVRNPVHFPQDAAHDTDALFAADVRPLHLDLVGRGLAGTQDRRGQART